MPLHSGTRLGPYEVTAAIGAGGMGEVYQARDTALDRDVAIKVLPEDFAADPDRLARFEREAKSLAALNHPNIAQIYGIEGDGSPSGLEETRPPSHFAIVMELVEGPTLAEKIGGLETQAALRTAGIPLDEALPIARQIAEALEAAHQAGIIHRDLKPANIKVRDDGTVKVLDFGLAKALAPEPGTTAADELANSPTITGHATREGVILGTAAYMAPEQAAGKTVDKRADVWAFGVVLFEMLTGRRAFDGSHGTEVLAAVIKSEPDWSALPTDLSPLLRTFLQRCMHKDPRHRVHDIADVRLALEGAFDTPTTDVAAMAVAQPAWRRPIPVAIAASVATVIIGLAAWNVWPSPQVGTGGDVVRFQLDLAPGQHLSGGYELETRDYALQRPSRPSFALSPDGRYLVYAASDGETTRLYRRPMNQDQATPIPGTDGGSRPFFAPNSQSVGFVVAGELERVPIDGGDVRTIAASGPIVAAYSWTEDDTILVAAADGISALPAAGGRLVPLTQIERTEGEQVHGYAQMLPGGRAVLFNVLIGSVPSDWAIVVQSLESGDRQTVVEGGSAPRYLASGHIVFARSGTLMAVPFDADRLEVTGDPVVVLEDVMHGEQGAHSGLNIGAAQFSVSNAGSLTYVPGGIYPARAGNLVLVNQRGEAEPLPLPPAHYLWPRFSPDGTRLSYTVGVAGSGDMQLWVYDLGLALPRALTSNGENVQAVWSPDSTRLVFTRRGADGGLFSIAADGSGAPERVAENLTGSPSAWSTDNVLAFLDVPGPGEPRGIWTLRMDGESQPEPFVATASSYPDFSPDGYWIAYVEGGEVYVRPFPAGAPVERVSPDGGSQPVWSPDGRQLFYTKANPDTRAAQVMVVDVVTEPAFRPSPERRLYEGPYGGTTPIRSFDISPDGVRFVMPEPVVAEPQPVTSIRVVQNWFDELKRLVPVR